MNGTLGQMNRFVLLLLLSICNFTSVQIKSLDGFLYHLCIYVLWRYIDRYAFWYGLLLFHNMLLRSGLFVILCDSKKGARVFAMIMCEACRWCAIPDGKLRFGLDKGAEYGSSCTAAERIRERKNHGQPVQFNWRGDEIIGTIRLNTWKKCRWPTGRWYRQCMYAELNCIRTMSCSGCPYSTNAKNHSKRVRLATARLCVRHLVLPVLPFPHPGVKSSGGVPYPIRRY